MGELNCGPIHSQGLLPFTRPSIPDMAEMQFIRDVKIIIFFFFKERKKGGGGRGLKKHPDVEELTFQ